MELNGEGAANYEQLKDLIRKECDKHDREYAQLEDKYNKLEQQVTHKDQQKNMAQRGRQSNNDATGASKKNKSVQKQSQNQRNKRQKNKVSSSQDQPNRQNSKNQEKAAENNNSTWQNNKNKTEFSLPNKSNRKLHKSNDKKKYNGVNQEKTNTPVWICCKLFTFKPPQRL